VNWSEYIRGAIVKKIEEQQLKDASAKLDEVRARAKPVSTDELVSWIREYRERQAYASIRDRRQCPSKVGSARRTLPGILRFEIEKIKSHFEMAIEKVAVISEK